MYVDNFIWKHCLRKTDKVWFNSSKNVTLPKYDKT